MTTEEFSNEFDILVDSYRRFKDFDNKEELDSLDFNEFEKSVFLTKAQEEIVSEFYNGKNPFKDSFEKTEEVRRFLSQLVRTYTTSDKEDDYTGLSQKSIFFKLPDDLWFITYESVTITDSRLRCMDNTDILVVPITQDDYFRVSKNPFRNPNNRRALRLDIENNIVEIISEYNVSKYLIRYVSKPEPIILLDLPDELSINGISVKTECELNPVIHRAILERAVKLAIISRVPNTGKE